MVKCLVDVDDGKRGVLTHLLWYSIASARAERGIVTMHATEVVSGLV